MKKELSKVYDPKEFEDRIYKFWMDNGCFRAEVDSKKKPYTIVIPPPNITGQLHMGHALDETLQDILIRWKRMSGYSALWLPGTDHAAIATEAKIVAAMREEGITKENLGREGFMERAWKWKEKYGGRIVEQLKKLGGLVYGGGNGGAGSVGAVGYSYGICANINGGKRAVPVGQLLRKGGAVPAAAGEYRAQRHGKIPHAGGVKLNKLHRGGAAQHPEA